MRGQTKSEVKGGVVHQADGHHSTYIHMTCQKVKTSYYDYDQYTNRPTRY